MQNSQQKIEQDINLLISHLKPAASTQFRSNIKDYCRKLLNSITSNRPNNQDPHLLKSKIIQKVHTQGDNKKVIDCQQRINKIMMANQIEKKGEIFKFLLKSSQFNNKGKNFSHIFEKELDLNRTYQQTINNSSVLSNINSYNQSNINMRPKRNINLQQQVTKIRERGSLSQQITQNDIIKSILFSLQNIQSWLISYNTQTDSYNLRDNIQVSPTVKELVRYLTQIGWLFKKIRNSVPQRGSIWKTLHYAVQFQLGQYYKWTAFMEQTIRNQNCNIRKIIRWSYEPLQSLKWIAIVLQSIQSYNGCQIITCINGFRPHGEPRINDMLVRLLSHLVQPLLLFIHNWMYKGELVDSYKQFFVKQNTKINEYQQWSSRFTLDQAKIPNILDKQSAIMIFNAGKTLNFLKNRCKCNYSISIPFIDPNKIINQQMYQSSNILSLQFKKWLTSVYENLSVKLMSQLRQKFHLKYHLHSMKHFYLMGKGDFIQHLIDNLKQQMSKPKHQIYENTLDGYINDAIIKSFQDFRIDIQTRQSIQIEIEGDKKKSKIQENKINQSQKMIMLKGSKTSKINNAKQIDHTNSYRANIIDRLLSKKVDFGQTTWDSFNFQYSMDKIQPLHSILTPQLVNNYQRIFQFLWKIKRIQHILKQIWVMNQKQYPKATMQKRFPQFFGILHKCHILRSSMSHFLNNFYGYLMIGIESAWDKFYKSLKLSTSLDEVIKQHRTLHNQLANITFGSTNKKILHQSLMNVFKSIEQFKTVQTKILSDYSQFFQRLRSYDNRKKIMAKGILNMEQDELDIPHFDESDLQNRIKQVEDIYNKTFKTLFDNLKKESQGGVLVFRLDFSQHYALKQIQNQ